MTVEEVEALADETRRAYAGKVVALSYCHLGDGTDEGYRNVQFLRKKPLLVMIYTPSGSLSHEKMWYEEENEDYLDTMWGGEALPGQLYHPDYVSWFYGPTFYLSAAGAVRRETDCWYKPPRQEVVGGLLVVVRHRVWVMRPGSITCLYKSNRASMTPTVRGLIKEKAPVGVILDALEEAEGGERREALMKTRQMFFSGEGIS